MEKLKNKVARRTPGSIRVDGDRKTLVRLSGSKGLHRSKDSNGVELPPNYMLKIARTVMCAKFSPKKI